MSRTSGAEQSRSPRSSFSLPPFTLSPAPYVVHYGTSPSSQSIAPLSPAERYATVKQLAAEYHGIFTESALRNLIWHAEAHARNPVPGARSNGFLSVIYRPGGARKVLLDRVAFTRWLESGKNAEVRNG